MSKKIIVKVSLELDSEILKEAFSSRGILQNQANVQRFLRLLRGASLGANDQLYDNVLGDRFQLVANGFSFVKEVEE